ncbi:hypothetical protein WJX81_005458 [Elliptochloris bilobata]|uniref:Uncharacterized protein n=1 Tax=Elliptochloris bilobata TaxID=381761 RepID=A0AAW1SA60_9CHLO
MVTTSSKHWGTLSCQPGRDHGDRNAACRRLSLVLAQPGGLTDTLSGEVGLDYNLNTRAAIPQYSLAYQLQRKGSTFATLRATPQMLMLRKSFHLTPPKVSFTLHTMAGVTYEGRPEFGFDVDNIKPTQVVAAAALAMLVLGKPLAGSRAFGGMQFGLPVNGDAVAKGEAKAMVERHGKGLQISLKQLNGVLRL